MKTDDWFKPFIATSIIILLIIFYWYSQNRRYIFSRSDANCYTLDSRTGIVYTVNSGKAYKLDLPSGKMTSSAIQRNDLEANK
jgi:hypothetical protein